MHQLENTTEADEVSEIVLPLRLNHEICYVPKRRAETAAGSRDQDPNDRFQAHTVLPVREGGDHRDTNRDHSRVVDERPEEGGREVRRRVDRVRSSRPRGFDERAGKKISDLSVPG